MSVEHYQAVWRCAALKGVLKLVALRLAWSTTDEDLCFPKLGTVGAWCGVSRQTVSGHVEALQRLGILELVAPAGHGRRSATYRFALEAFEGLPRVNILVSRNPTAADETAPGGVGKADSKCRESRQQVSGKPTPNDKDLNKGFDEAGACASPATAEAVVAPSPEAERAEGPGGEPGSPVLRQVWLGMQGAIAADVGAVRHRSWVAPLIPWAREGGADGAVDLLLLAPSRLFLDRLGTTDPALLNAIKRAWRGAGGAGVRLVLSAELVAAGSAARPLPPKAFDDMARAATRAAEGAAAASVGAGD